MLRALIFNITLAGFGLAIPTISPSYNSFTQIDLVMTRIELFLFSCHTKSPQQFDDITGATGVAVAPVGSNSIYKTLKFNGFSLVATLGPSTNNLPNVIAQSDPNYIAFSALDAESVLQGPHHSTSKTQSCQAGIREQIFNADISS